MARLAEREGKRKASTLRSTVVFLKSTVRADRPQSEGSAGSTREGKITDRKRVCVTEEHEVTGGGTVGGDHLGKKLNFEGKIYLRTVFI